MSIVRTADELCRQIRDTAESLVSLVQTAARDGRPVHEVEQALWQTFQQLGQQYLGHFFALAGDGDMGETVGNDDGQVWQRLEHKHPRTYVSIFGTWTKRLRRGKSADYAGCAGLEGPASHDCGVG